MEPDSGLAYNLVFKPRTERLGFAEGGFRSDKKTVTVLGLW